jgi:hypothetical protein
MTDKELEPYAKLLYENLEGFEQRALTNIGTRIKLIGQLDATDKKALENLSNIGVPLQQIYEDLANVLEVSIEEVETMYNDFAIAKDTEIEKMAKVKDMPFLPYSENMFARQMVQNWVEQTSGEMINLSRTKAIGFSGTLPSGVEMSVTMEKAYQQVVDKAIAAVRTGVSDFNTEMYGALKDLGGSGIKTIYESGRAVRLDATIRQWILYGLKQSSQQYEEYIGEQFGADGIEVDYHPAPRKSHEFMGGRTFSLYGRKKINGIVYEDATEALRRLEDYNCLHVKRHVLLGISMPNWDADELEKLKAKDKQKITYKGESKTPYEWKQQNQRVMEREYREKDGQRVILEASGNTQKSDELKKDLRQIKSSYKELCDATGLQPKLERMRIN